MWISNILRSITACLMVYSTRVESALTASWSDSTMSFDISIDVDASLVTITMSGSDSFYFSAGFGKVVMDNCYCIVVEAGGVVSEWVCEGHNAGTQSSNSLSELSTVANSGVRTIVMTRAITGTDYSFPTTAGASIPYIWAYSNKRATYDRHSSDGSGTLTLVAANPTPSPTAQPTPAPTMLPIPAPTAPSAAPTRSPTFTGETYAPTDAPTVVPTMSPTMPTSVPTDVTQNPTVMTSAPTSVTGLPTPSPTGQDAEVDHGEVCTTDDCKEIAFQSLTDVDMTISLAINATHILIEMYGPIDRYFAVGWGTHGFGDAVAWIDGDSLQDFVLTGTGDSEVYADTNQDWLLMASFAVDGSQYVRCVRVLDSNDGWDDLPFVYEDDEIYFRYAMGVSSGSQSMADHGGYRGEVTFNLITGGATFIESQRQFTNQEHILFMIFGAIVLPSLGLVLQCSNVWPCCQHYQFLSFQLFRSAFIIGCLLSIVGIASKIAQLGEIASNDYHPLAGFAWVVLFIIGNGGLIIISMKPNFVESHSTVPKASLIGKSVIYLLYALAALGIVIAVAQMIKKGELIAMSLVVVYLLALVGVMVATRFLKASSAGKNAHTPAWDRAKSASSKQ